VVSDHWRHCFYAVGIGGDVVITQEDREAAAAYWRLSRIGNDGTHARYLSGDADESFIVKAFSRHRIAAENAQRERDAAFLESVAVRFRDAAKVQGMKAGPLAHAYEHAAKAIREQNND
jgi:hypothetical protein